MWGPPRLSFQNIATLLTVTVVATLIISGAGHGGEGVSPSTGFPPGCASRIPTGSVAIGEYLNLTILVDLVNGHVHFTPVDFTVPSHTLLEVTVTNYDTRTSPVSSPYLNVCGTVGGTEVRNGVSVSALPQGGVSHTFTIPDGTLAGFNVPLPPAAVNAPSTVIFQAYFVTPGTYSWQSEAGSDGSQGTADGPLSGTLTVQ